MVAWIGIGKCSSDWTTTDIGGSTITTQGRRNVVKSTHRHERVVAVSGAFGSQRQIVYAMCIGVLHVTATKRETPEVRERDTD